MPVYRQQTFDQNSIELAQPKPLPLKRVYTRFLEDLDSISSNPAPKRFCSDSLDTFVSQWLESTSAVDAERQKSCKSDTFLETRDENPVFKRLTKSVSNMTSQYTPDGFLVPSAPASATSSIPSVITSRNSRFSTAGSNSGKSLVEQPLYRDENLFFNHIHLRRGYEDLPEGVARLVDGMSRRRASPGPPLDEIKLSENLAEVEMGRFDSQVEGCFRGHIFPSATGSDVLRRDDRIPMIKNAVPSFHPTCKVSTPVPDMLYGYRRNFAFVDQKIPLFSMKMDIYANSQLLAFPFFAIEFKGDGGNLAAATNQCLGDSATCINIAEVLNNQLGACGSEEVQAIDSTAFSIAIFGHFANLYVSWKHSDLEFYTRRVRAFCLQEPDQYLEFRKYVRNIIDWGRDVRLKSIQESLDFLHEQSRRRASEEAKNRVPSSSAFDSPSSKRPRGF